MLLSVITPNYGHLFPALLHWGHVGGLEMTIMEVFTAWELETLLTKAFISQRASCETLTSTPVP